MWFNPRPSVSLLCVPTNDQMIQSNVEPPYINVVQNELFLNQLIWKQLTRYPVDTDEFNFQKYLNFSAEINFKESYPYKRKFKRLLVYGKHHQLSSFFYEESEFFIRKLSAYFVRVNHIGQSWTLNHSCKRFNDFGFSIGLFIPCSSDGCETKFRIFLFCGLKTLLKWFWKWPFTFL